METLIHRISIGSTLLKFSFSHILNVFACFVSKSEIHCINRLCPMSPVLSAFVVQINNGFTSERSKYRIVFRFSIHCLMRWSLDACLERSIKHIVLGSSRLEPKSITQSWLGHDCSRNYHNWVDSWFSWPILPFLLRRTEVISYSHEFEESLDFLGFIFAGIVAHKYHQFMFGT